LNTTVNYRSLLYLIIGLLNIAAVGCQPTVYLMPTPSIMATGEINPFNINPNLEESNRVAVLFATNRIPVGDDDSKSYTIFPGNKLRLGIAYFTIGGKATDWRQIFELSTSDENRDRPALHLEDLKELAVIPLDDETAPLPKEVESFAAAVNGVLADSLDKDIMVYVHGANSSTYRAAAQAAQYRHFTGRNSMVLAFLWPSAENIFAYGTDVRHAAKSAPAFRRLITLLNDYTTAENINILAYSAGSQIASPGLAILGLEEKGEKRRQLRLGEVYFAGADIGIDTFVENLQTYLDIPRSVTLTINLKDTVLAMAEWHHGVSRAGRPRAEDLSPEAAQWARTASAGSGFDIIGVDENTVVGLSSGAHDFWYAHPWISSDVLVQFLFHADPLKRGLVENVNEYGLRYWTFPPDYPDRIIGIIKEAKKEEAQSR
jgi:esterase/lipase superfamily enzyme